MERVTRTAIVDYDSNGFDYRTYWDGRRYEQRAEEHALGRLVPRLGRPRWLVDFGGGFGRNAAHYSAIADRYVLVDYSANNLDAATTVLAGDVAAGRAFLVRADLNALPFVDAGFEAAIVVRVLHHLPDITGALAEMGRVVGHRWLLDIPIKHHALGLLRAAARGELRSVLDPAPRVTGTSTDPFRNFQLAAVRRLLTGYGWDSRVVASVNNLRRWDRRLPAGLVRALDPAAHLAESAAQRIGTGWWGPNQFVLAERPVPVAFHASADRVPPSVAALAGRMACPHCRGGLAWTPDAATCRRCDRRYARVGSYWDFTVDAATAAPPLSRVATPGAGR